MWLLIDDIRDLNCEVIARTPAAAKKMLALGGWSCVAFDHDLGAEESGYDILKWAQMSDFLPYCIQLVSSSPAERLNMAGLLQDNGYKSKDGRNWIKE